MLLTDIVVNSSYLANLSKIVNPVSIAGKCPDWYHGPQYKKLAPKISFFSEYKAGRITSYEYTLAYRDEVLAGLSYNEVLDDLFAFYPGASEVTILCYEKPTDFCHRHLVIEWFKQRGIKAAEKLFYPYSMVYKI